MKLTMKDVEKAIIESGEVRTVQDAKLLYVRHIARLIPDLEAAAPWILLNI